MRHSVEMVANIGHELLTPMSGIMGMTEALAKSPLSLEQRTNLHLLQTSASTMLGKVETLLEFYMLETGHVKLSSEAFDIEDLLRELISP